MVIRINLGRVLKWTTTIGVCAFLLHACYDSCFSPEAKQLQAQERAAEEAKKEADRKPRKVSTGEDGCETWAFKPHDRWLYSMRCPDSKTDTRNEWEVCKTTTVGKTQTTTCEIQGTNVPFAKK